MDAAKIFAKFLRETFPQNAMRQKMLAELLREKEDAAFEIKDLLHTLQTGGRVLMMSDIASSGNSFTLRRRMQIQYGWTWHPSDDRTVRFSIDSLDAGWGGGATRSLFPELLDASWSERFYFQKQEFEVLATAGGDTLFQNAPAPLFPQEQDQILKRNTNRLFLSSILWGKPVGAGLTTRNPSGAGGGTLPSLEIHGGMLEGYLLPGGARVRFLLPSISFLKGSWKGDLWGANLDPNELAYDIHAQWGEAEKNFWKVQFGAAGSNFHKTAPEIAQWILPSPLGWGVRNGFRLTAFSMGWRAFYPIELLWNSEWLADNQNPMQAHRVRLRMPWIENVHIEFLAQFFESPSGLSWWGTPLALSRSSSIQSSVQLDIP